MNKVIFAAATAAVLSMGAPSALAQDGQVKAAPVDFRACTFRDGKGMKDLDKVSEKFRAYANKNDFNYAAWVLGPGAGVPECRALRYRLAGRLALQPGFWRQHGKVENLQQWPGGRI